MTATNRRDHPIMRELEDLGYTVREPKTVEGGYEIIATTLGTFHEVHGRGATIEEALERLRGSVVETEDQLKITQIQKGLDESAGNSDALDQEAEVTEVTEKSSKQQILESIAEFGYEIRDYRIAAKRPPLDRQATGNHTEFGEGATEEEALYALMQAILKRENPRGYSES